MSNDGHQDRPILQDYARWKKILKGKIRDNLRDYMGQSVSRGIRGGEIVEVEIPHIHLPEFRYDVRQMGGVGAGDGEVGEPVPQPGEGEGEGEDDGEPGDEPGDHSWGSDVDKEDLADILGDELGLPDIEPKGNENMVLGQEKWKEERQAGPESLLRLWPYMRDAQMRGQASIEVNYDDYLEDLSAPVPDALDNIVDRKELREDDGLDPMLWLHHDIESDPNVEKYKQSEPRKTIIEFLEEEMEEDPTTAGATPVFDPEQRKYRYTSPEEEPEYSAVVIHMMDVSGSMRGEKKEIAKNIFFWSDLWIEHQYDEVNHVYIVHDHEAQEVTREEFYGINTMGGTRISSAYEMTDDEMVGPGGRYDPSDWNIYPIHLSDGENWEEDSQRCVTLLEGGEHSEGGDPFRGTQGQSHDYDGLLKRVNMFAFGEIVPHGGSSWAVHKDVLDDELGDRQEVRTYRAESRDDIYDTIKEFFGEGY